MIGWWHFFVVTWMSSLDNFNKLTITKHKNTHELLDHLLNSLLFSYILFNLFCDQVTLLLVIEREVLCNCLQVFYVQLAYLLNFHTLWWLIFRVTILSRSTIWISDYLFKTREILMQENSNVALNLLLQIFLPITNIRDSLCHSKVRQILVNEVDIVKFEQHLVLLRVFKLCLS